MQTISKTAQERMTGNQKVIGRLMALFNKSSDTIGRLIAKRHILLTTPGAIAIIKEETSLTEEQIFETEVEGMRA